MLSVKKLDRSWQVVPGMTLGGVLGAQTGSAGAADVDTNAPCVDPWGVYYYHYNDLGAVLATTDKDGWPIGIYQPDYYGNYHAAAKYGQRPDTMGLTGKFEDQEAKLNYVNARWYDPERGSWISKDPIVSESHNLYQFSRNSPGEFFDLDGRSAAGAVAGIAALVAGTYIWWTGPSREALTNARDVCDSICNNAKSLDTLQYNYPNGITHANGTHTSWVDLFMGAEQARQACIQCRKNTCSVSAFAASAASGPTSLGGIGIATDVAGYSAGMLVTVATTDPPIKK